MKKEIVMQDILELVVIDQKAYFVINAIQVILLWELLVVVYTTQHAQVDIPLHGIVNLVHGYVLHQIINEQLLQLLLLPQRHIIDMHQMEIKLFITAKVVGIYTLIQMNGITIPKTYALLTML